MKRSMKICGLVIALTITSMPLSAFQTYKEKAVSSLKKGVAFTMLVGDAASEFYGRGKRLERRSRNASNPYEELPDQVMEAQLRTGYTLPLPAGVTPVALHVRTQSGFPQIEVLTVNNGHDQVTSAAIQSWSTTSWNSVVDQTTTPVTNQADLNFLSSTIAQPMPQPEGKWSLYNFFKIAQRDPNFLSKFEDSLIHDSSARLPVDPVTKIQCKTAAGTYHVKLTEDEQGTPAVFVKLKPSGFLRRLNWMREQLLSND